MAEPLYSGWFQYVENRAPCVSSITKMIHDAVAHTSPLKVCISSAQETFISNYQQIVVTCTVSLEESTFFPHARLLLAPVEQLQTVRISTPSALGVAGKSRTSRVKRGPVTALPPTHNRSPLLRRKEDGRGRNVSRECRQTIVAASGTKTGSTAEDKIMENLFIQLIVPLQDH